MKHLFYKPSSNIHKDYINEIILQNITRVANVQRNKFYTYTLLHPILTAPNRSDRFLQPVSPVVTA